MIFYYLFIYFTFVFFFSAWLYFVPKKLCNRSDKTQLKIVISSGLFSQSTLGIVEILPTIDSTYLNQNLQQY